MMIGGEVGPTIQNDVGRILAQSRAWGDSTTFSDG